jgi:hypothetical protein
MVKELETGSNENQIRELAKKEKKNALIVAHNFNASYRIAQEFNFNDLHESDLFELHFAQYLVSKTGYKHNFFSNSPFSVLAAQISSFWTDPEEEEIRNRVKRKASEDLMKIIDEEMATVKTMEKEEGISFRIQNLANQLSNSYLDHPKDAKKIKEDIVKEKQRLSKTIAFTLSK